MILLRGMECYIYNKSTLWGCFITKTPLQPLTVKCVPLNHVAIFAIKNGNYGNGIATINMFWKKSACLSIELTSCSTAAVIRWKQTDCPIRASKSFSVAVLTVFNKFPEAVRNCDTASNFGIKLKTFLFYRAYKIWGHPNLLACESSIILTLWHVAKLYLYCFV